MTRDEFRESLIKAYGGRPYYYRYDKECAEIRGERKISMANSDRKHGLKPFYIGRLAAYPTEQLIAYAVSRFSEV